MGTLVSISISLSNVKESKARELTSSAFDLMSGLEKKFSIDSDYLRAIKKNAGLEKFTSIPPEVLFVIKKGIYFGDLSGGRFDITISPLLKLWGFYEMEASEKNSDIPSKDEIKKILPLINYKKVQIKGSKVYLEKKGMSLELGGLAKGYIVDMASEFLKKNGVAFIVDAGGDMAISGKKREKTSWKIGVQNPWDKKGIVSVLELSNISVATSGNYERFIIKNGIKYHHILEPETGYPAKDVASVTVIASSTMQADALSTAAFLLGPLKGFELLENTPDVEGILITGKKKIMKTSGINADIFIDG